MPALPGGEGWPAFLIVVDVGHVIELYSEFTRQGKTYVPFPNPQSFRIKLADLGDAGIRQRLALVWTDPLALDPSRKSAKVTRDLASRLAELAKLLEKSGARAGPRGAVPDALPVHDVRRGCRADPQGRLKKSCSPNWKATRRPSRR